MSVAESEGLARERRGNSFASLFASTYSWIDLHETEFSVAAYIDSPRILELIKPLGELAIACGLFSELVPQENWRFKRKLQFAWEEFHRGALLEEILTSRPDLLVLSSIYSTFRQAGFQRRTLEDQIEKLVKTPGYFGADLPAWRKLDLLYGLSKMAVHSNVDLLAVFERTWLAGMHSPWTITEASAYGATHTIFYMTDFGKHSGKWSLEVEDYLKTALSWWTDHFFREGNFDLAAEMLMARYCVGQRDIDQRLASALAAGQLSDGSMCSPSHSAVSLLYGETKPHRETFLSRYHTTLVTSIASAMHAFGNI